MLRKGMANNQRNPGCGVGHDSEHMPTTHENSEGGMRSPVREAHQKKRMAKHQYHGTPTAEHSRNFEQRSEQHITGPSYE